MNCSIESTNVSEELDMESLRDMDFQFVEDTISEYLEKQKYIKEWKQEQKRKQERDDD